MRRRAKQFLTAALALCLCFTFSITSLAVDESTDLDDTIISHSETWVTSQKHIAVTVYDLGDGVIATETTVDEYGLTRATGIKTQTKTYEIKDKSVLAATITVSGTFSYNGNDCTVDSASQSRTIYSGYSEDSWATGQRDYNWFFGDAIVSASLIITRDTDGKKFPGVVMVTCGVNG